MTALYGAAPTVGETRAIPYIQATQKTIFLPDEPAYREAMKSTTCDAQGNFEFSALKDGDYYIVTAVIWRVRGYEGGLVSTRATVRNGKSARLIMTRS